MAVKPRCLVGLAACVDQVGLGWISEKGYAAAAAVAVAAVQCTAAGARGAGVLGLDCPWTREADGGSFAGGGDGVDGGDCGNGVKHGVAHGVH